ncbi:thiamine biosynthesis protein-like protein (Thi-4) [Tothia fuscella]|uniref:Thiamine biosynthesis protein-like protein (Thi-4) n=1 Tax=Tothia fuscella TaxID=1048955 RepID=A0A9P4NU10_9PEZI|nr:thiamine biosynthesis protein-like protein (Thi-4) [Tothia fuscella]
MNRILVIAGSDSSGGAGLEADQKVIAAHGCYAMTATTALTAQNTQGIFDIHQIPPAFLKKQIDACIDDIAVDVVKTGMLASAETISVVADALRRHNVPLTVVDPVMVATSGAQLLPEKAVAKLLQELFPLTTILTPNLPEAKLLLQTAKVAFQEPHTRDDLIHIARALQKLGPKYVLLKGGHVPLTKDKTISKHDAEYHIVFNVLAGPEGYKSFETEYLRSRNTHGTGCSLASAIACNIANGMSVTAAVQAGNRYVEAGIKTSRDIGKGTGPINHFHSTYTLPFSPGHFIDYLLEREDVAGPWKEYTEHQFVRQMADGTLPVDKFKAYLVQDYLFLTQFSRSNALAAYKAKSLDDINRSADIVRHVYAELKLHIDYCSEWGLSKEDIVNHEEQQACTAYTRYVLDIGNSEDWFALQIALLACLMGYGVIAKQLHDDQETVKEDNRYWKWIENYVAPDYTEAVELGRGLIEKHAVNQSPHRIEELVKIFVQVTKLEIGFWNMGCKG